MTQICSVRRSKIPENKQRKLAAISRRESEKLKALGKRKLAKNALAWERHFLEQADSLAKRATVLHWKRVPKGVCKRKDSNIDEVKVSPHIIEHASAYHLENVDCLVCRRWARENPTRQRNKALKGNHDQSN